MIISTPQPVTQSQVKDALASSPIIHNSIDSISMPPYHVWLQSQYAQTCMITFEAAYRGERTDHMLRQRVDKEMRRVYSEIPNKAREWISKHGVEHWNHIKHKFGV